jgi:predicted ATPase with chaperone activity
MTTMGTTQDNSTTINALLDQIRNIAKEGLEETPPSAQPSDPVSLGEFIPKAPKSLYHAGVSDTFVEELICKYLLAKGETSGREIAEQIKLGYPIVEEILNRLKKEQILSYIGQAALNDYICKLSEMGRERALRYTRACTYYGAAPVPLRDYIQAIKAQSLETQHPSEDDLRRAFSDLLINQGMFNRLGPAVNSGKGMFLYGYPGNGKTSIAERITVAFGKYIWIPRSILIDTDVVRLYDPMVHTPAPLENRSGLLATEEVDKRWVRIVRPTIVVGGELTMEHLEINFNHVTGISEAPVQLKSNCGTLVIDDFGRQRISVTELLNRWIVPLEKRYDYLRASNGKKIQVPFDQLVIFSTNLEPKDLVDDAFLRRIPYKIEVPNPTREEFTKLFEIIAPKMGFEFQRSLIENLIEKHYVPVNRPFRNCHPRDLLLQIKNYCLYKKAPMLLSDQGFDFACDNYFSIV